MIKTIQIGDKEVQLNNNIGWTLAYKDQFNTDILPTMMPIVAGISDAMIGLLESVGSTKDLNNFSLDDFVEVAKTEEFTSALIKVSSFELTDLINITWAMAKCADDSIPEPKRWVREFEEFPLDVIAPAVFELGIGGLISSKNWERLQKAIASLKPKEEKKIQ